MAKFRVQIFLLSMVSAIAAISLSGCQSLDVLWTPTTLERIDFKPVAKPEWQGKTIYVDFEADAFSWSRHFRSNLSQNIRDQVIDGIIEDGIFHVQDRPTLTKYMYRVQVRIADPVIEGSDSLIDSISASFRIKTYDASGNLVMARTQNVRYNAPAVNVSVNGSQRELIENYVHNAAQEIRKVVYEGFR